MSLADRTQYRHGQPKVITCGNHLLRIENRELYTTYRLESWNHGPLLRLDVRNCYPLPPYEPRIIYARTIPWFMWIIYGIRDWFSKQRHNRELEEWFKRDLARRKAIRDLAEKRMGAGRFGGRYNR